MKKIRIVFHIILVVHTLSNFILNFVFVAQISQEVIHEKSTFGIKASF